MPSMSPSQYVTHPSAQLPELTVPVQPHQQANANAGHRINQPSNEDVEAYRAHIKSYMLPAQDAYMGDMKEKFIQNNIGSIIATRRIRASVNLEEPHSKDEIKDARLIAAIEWQMKSLASYCLEQQWPHSKEHHEALQIANAAWDAMNPSFTSCRLVSRRQEEGRAAGLRRLVPLQAVPGQPAILAIENDGADEDENNPLVKFLMEDVGELRLDYAPRGGITEAGVEQRLKEVGVPPKIAEQLSMHIATAQEVGRARKVPLDSPIPTTHFIQNLPKSIKNTAGQTRALEYYMLCSPVRSKRNENADSEE